jgi:hypothetical protein
MMNRKKLIVTALSLIMATGALAQSASTAKLKKYVDYFNSIDNEAVKNHVNNAQSFDWLSQNVPLLECPDEVLEQNYYYRWWSFRKHLVKTPEGFIFTEFIEPVKHAGKYNSYL